MNTPPDASLAVVVIGRNEGERLRRCLMSVLPHAACVVYVDSGSTDGSAEMARSLGAEVLALDLSLPFTAARARNVGWRRALELQPQVHHLQFVDGDCEVIPGWIATSRGFLESHPTYAAVYGRRRERHPDESIYNRLCDIEWNTPIGESLYFGGDVMLRRDALQQVDGYRDDLIAGEEPEMCVRLRAADWRIYRLEVDMTWHDAAITRFAQWWRRSLRSGYAFAEGAHLHGAPPERHWVRESRSAWVWGLALPLLAAAAWWAVGPLGLVLLLAYPLQLARLMLRAEGTPRQRLARAGFLLLGKFSEAAGQLRYVFERSLGRQGHIIEYK